MGDFRFEIWPTEYRFIAQHFGVNPRYYAQFGLPGHEGVDIKAPAGSKVFAVARGEVYRVHENPNKHNYGIHVRIAHERGFKTIYAHLDKALVKNGQIVEAGTLIGAAGSSGNSFGSNLHLALKKSADANKPNNIWEARKREAEVVSDWPLDFLDPTPYLLPLIGWKEPVGPYLEGWILDNCLFECGDLAQVNTGGATLYKEIEKSYFIPAGTLVIVDAKRKPYARIRVPKAAIGLQDISAIVPEPEPPPLMSTFDGWVWNRHLVIVGKQAVIGSHGTIFKAEPDSSAANIGMVKAGSTVSVLGESNGQFRPVRARRIDFIEPVAPVDLPPLIVNGAPKEGYIGWVLTQYLSPLKGELALTSKFGVNLRNRPDDEGTNMGLVKAFATVRITGSGEREYTPVSIREQDVINIVDPLPQSTLPISRFEQEQAVIEPVTEESSIPGWVFTNELELLGGTARVSAFGSSLRAEPRRDASKVGFITPGNLVVLTGTEQGEYLPVRVWEKELQPVLPESDDTGADAIVLGNARIGLHASLDLVITGKEQRLFETLRPGIIKVFSTHGSEDIKRLAKAHSKAQWIVRAKAPFGSRLVSPGQFYGETVDDVRRILKMLPERSVVIELHSKPNTALEGLESSWSDGKAFEQWWLELLDRYRQELPDAQFLYPGLAVGGGVTGVKEDHIRFLEASRKAVEEADGMGLHLYWSEYTSPNQVLAILDDTITRFRDKPLWITEAGRVGEVLSTEIAAGEYLNLWAELQVRPAVRGVVYFTTPAENGEIGQQVLIGEELVKVIGRR